MMDYDVFLSYASEDKSVMEDLATHLQKAGLKVWLDSLEIRLGDDIAEEINMTAL